MRPLRASRPARGAGLIATVSDAIGRFGELDVLVLVEPDSTCVAMASRTAGPHLARSGGPFVGMARAEAARALSMAGIPVVEVPDGDVDDHAAADLGGAALRHVRDGLSSSLRTLRGPAVRP